MKHLRKYNESKQELTKEDLQNFFAHTFDLCDSGKAITIDIVYFDPKHERDWAHNDFSGGSSGDVECVEGFELSFHHDFYDTVTLEEFNKFSNIVSELYNDANRFKSIYNPSEIFFVNNDDAIIKLLVRP